MQKLTPAESAVMHGLLRGLTHEQIAQERGTAVRTIANQVAAMYRKLDIHSRAELFHVLRPQRPEVAAAPRSLETLDARTRTILAKRAMGQSLKVIASDLSLSEATIHRELRRAMALLGIDSPAELACALDTDEIS